MLAEAVVLEPVASPRRGRPVGSKNRRTEQVEQLLRPMVPKARKRLLAMLRGADDELAFRAATTVFAYVYGKPRERHEMTGADGKDLMPATGISVPRVMQWLAVLAPEMNNSELHAEATKLVEKAQLALPSPGGGR